MSDFSDEYFTEEGFEEVNWRAENMLNFIESHKMPLYQRIEKRRKVMNYIEHYEEIYFQKIIEEEKKSFIFGETDSFSLN